MQIFAQFHPFGKSARVFSFYVDAVPNGAMFRCSQLFANGECVVESSLFSIAAANPPATTTATTSSSSRRGQWDKEWREREKDWPKEEEEGSEVRSGTEKKKGEEEEEDATSTSDRFILRSQELSLALANRSACLELAGKHSQALEDARLALIYGYPSEKRSKLDLRRGQCMLSMMEKEMMMMGKGTTTKATSAKGLLLLGKASRRALEMALKEPVLEMRVAEKLRRLDSLERQLDCGRGEDPDGDDAKGNGRPTAANTRGTGEGHRDNEDKRREASCERGS